MVETSYKLIAAIYHHGKNAAGGHYTCDVYHHAKASWLRIDDTDVTSVTREDVLSGAQSDSGRLPYILFYQLQNVADQAL